ncbi:translocation/assembly module TamB domain-containing protein [Tenacibaculum sp. IB213877]|uniref:translocation/assembly module TamB domain-containing protein n=1 Tax=Tenacibaculum sp. IB213877 TaxID=3097351 RepID=UPI002A5AC18F|nr:translocation/assembly module TamB domain-containing protein [Tenacibaculum sp. IB213877]MDY0781080.1 translocation/assembly module TamB domain-containing protein [Tenacibaculum sp. IB213877]
MLFLSIPAVQSKLAKIATNFINKEFNTHIVVKKLDLSLLGSIQLKQIEIRDHHQDTLIFVKNLKTSLRNAKMVLDNKVNLGDATLTGVHFYMKTYKGEDSDNMNIFIDNFDNGSQTKSVTPFILRTKNIYIDDLTYKLINENKENTLQFAAYNAGGNLQNFSLIGPNITADIKGLYFTENRGVHITSLSTDFAYTKTNMLFKNTVLKTDNGSDVNADIQFKYKRKDFADFIDKVKVTGNFKKSSISVLDLNRLYGELGGADMAYFTGKMSGVLNNFSLSNFDMYSKNGMQVKGDMGFVNAFNTDRGFIFDAELDKVSSTYNQLRNILPNVLGRTLPSDFKKIGRFTMSGLVKVTPEQMDATLRVNSEIGNTTSDLLITGIDNMDNAEYSGEIEFINFDLGVITNDSSLGKVSLRADVQGKGFNVDNINTTVIGKISSIEYNNYTYKDVNVNGEFQNKKFDGYLESKDENFNMTFKGLADFSSDINNFDFTADIDKIDLLKTNFFKRDSISLLKGTIKLDVSGNKLDDVVGKATFQDLVYTNQKKSYEFKKFEINSSVKDSVKTIEVDSKDIAEGKLEGKFTFNELLPVFQNALGSVYTNYKPIPVAPNQYINFNFTIYNQIVDIFLPKVSIGADTQIRGKINSNENSVKLTFSSPELDVYENAIEEVVLRLDNKNKLYNTHFTAQKISNKNYNVTDLNLLNRTVNDTLFFKTTFKGGRKKIEDNFNLNFYYTINEDRKSVVGIQKSTFKHNGFDWQINPEDNNLNNVAFDLTNDSFSFSPFSLISENMQIAFEGDMQGENYKDLKASFSSVHLEALLPEIENLKLNGSLNGTAALKQDNNIIKPVANLTVNDLIVNEFSQGTLKIKVEGQNSFNKYNVDFSIRDYEFDNVKATGSLDFSSNNPTMDLAVNFREYELNGFSDFGGDVISNLRGRLSGNFTSKGSISNPNFKGNLNLIEAGVTFPYLNIDYDFIENANIKLQDQTFLVKNIVLEDTKYDTKGYLSGSVTHQNFEQWYLNLDLNTPNMLVLDTKEADNIPYYGTGFLRGNAQIRGLSSNLSIDVNGSTQPGTIFVIPLSDVTTVNNYRLIRFKTVEDVDENILNIDKFKGLNLKINLTVTKDAVAQVVIDKVSGSDLKGSGTGNLQIEIDTRGKFNMYGDVTIDNGVYNFRYGGIVNKPFTVQKGGTISWNGDPLDAELDLTAVYRTKANPAQLLDNINSTRKIPIDLYTRITGGLFNSKQDFDIKIPNANSTVTSELEFKINENDLNTKMQHFTFLLAFGTFYNEETIGNSASAGITGTAAQVATGILSNMINSKDGKFQVGVGYTQGDKADVNRLTNAIDDQVDVSVSTQLSDRVIVNGKVGVPVGTNTQTSVVGEVKVEVLLNEQGTLRGTFFNKPNDVQYSLEDEGYTQGLGLSYQVNFNNMKELKEKIGLKKKEKEKKKDTIIARERSLINFKRKIDTTKVKNEPNN